MEVAIDDVDEAGRFETALRALEERLTVLSEKRELMVGLRAQLAPLEAYVAAKKDEYTGLEQANDDEAKAIKDETKELRREIAAARKGLDAGHKQELKKLASEHKSALADLDRVAEEVDELGDDEEDD